MKRRLLLLAMLGAAVPAFAADEKKPAESKANESDTFDQDSVLKDAEAFFGKGAEGLGVGPRAGASIGYVHYTSKKRYNPF